MPDLPHRSFLLLPPPEGGLRDALLRGRVRRLRSASAVSGAGLAVGVGLLFAVPSLLGSATADRLNPAPYGRDLLPEPPATPGPSTPTPAAPGPSTPTPAAAPPAGPAPASASVAPAPGRVAASAPTVVSSVAPVAPALPGAPRNGEARSDSPSGIRRSYVPPAQDGFRLCGSSAEVGSGSARAYVDWCQTLDVQPTDGGHRLLLAVCRSTNSGPDVLHVDARSPVALRVARGDTEMWRLPASPPAALEQLPTDAGGCWVWEYLWDGADAASRPLPSGRYTAFGTSLAEQTRELPEQQRPLEIS